VKEFAEEEGDKSPFRILNKDITRVLTTILVATTVCSIYSAALFTNLAIQVTTSFSCRAVVRGCCADCLAPQRCRARHELELWGCRCVTSAVRAAGPVRVCRRSLPLALALLTLLPLLHRHMYVMMVCVRRCLEPRGWRTRRPPSPSSPSSSASCCPR
jgi:hypothetical protein